MASTNFEDLLHLKDCPSPATLSSTWTLSFNQKTCCYFLLCPISLLMIIDSHWNNCSRQHTFLNMQVFQLKHQHVIYRRHLSWLCLAQDFFKRAIKIKFVHMQIIVHMWNLVGLSFYSYIILLWLQSRTVTLLKATCNNLSEWQIVNKPDFPIEWNRNGQLNGLSIDSVERQSGGCMVHNRK